jgi:hypothetical protein
MISGACPWDLLLLDSTQAWAGRRISITPAQALEIGPVLAVFPAACSRLAFAGLAFGV